MNEADNLQEQKGNGVLPCVSNSLLNKGKMLVEANEYADKCVRRTLFGKSRELAKQRIIVMYLLDEIDRLSRNDC
jgi:hypothetical protein